MTDRLFTFAVGVVVGAVCTIVWAAWKEIERVVH